MTDNNTWIQWKDEDQNEELGSGAYGEVRKCRDPNTNMYYAVKRVKNANKIMSINEVPEIAVLKKIKHKSVVEYVLCEVTRRYLFIVMEYMPGGTVKNEIRDNGKLAETLVIHYAKQILEGIGHLHENKIVHRDIKNENVLRDLDRNVKLCDFGISKQLETYCGKSDQYNTNLCGTVFFMAPEVIKGNEYGRQADIWSLGCAIVEMLTGYPPWAQKGAKDAWGAWLFNTAEHALAKYDLPENVSANMEAFLKGLFLRDPACRPTAINALSDPLFKKFGKIAEPSNIQIKKSVQEALVPFAMSADAERLLEDTKGKLSIRSDSVVIQVEKEFGRIITIDEKPPIPERKKKESTINVEAVPDRENKLDKFPVTKDQVDSASIQIRNISKLSSENLLSDYLFSERRSNGGEIKQFNCKSHFDLAIVEFRNVATATRVLNRSHVLDNQNIYTSMLPPKCKNSVFLKNIPQWVTVDELTIYLEGRVRMDVRSVNFNDIDDGAIVTFLEDIDSDALAIAIMKRPFKNGLKQIQPAEIEVFPVVYPDAILLFCNDPSQDSVEIALEGYLSRINPNEKYTVRYSIYKPEKETWLVCFDSYEAVRLFPHNCEITINKKNYQLAPYFDCLGWQTKDNKGTPNFLRIFGPATVNQNLCESEALFLTGTLGRSYIEQELKNNCWNGCFIMKEKINLNVTAENIEKSRDMLRFILNCIKTFGMKLNEEMKIAWVSENAENFLSRINTTTNIDNYFAWALNDDTLNFTFAAAKEEPVKNVVKRFFNDNTIYQEIVLNAGIQGLYLKKFHQTAFMQKTIIPDAIKFLQNGAIQMKGTKCQIEMLQADIKTVLIGTDLFEYIINGPGMANFFRSQTGFTDITTITDRTHTLIISEDELFVETGKVEPIPTRPTVLDETKNEKRKQFEGVLNGKIKVNVRQNDITAEEVGAIVNAANENAVTNVVHLNGIKIEIIESIKHANTVGCIISCLGDIGIMQGKPVFQLPAPVDDLDKWQALFEQSLTNSARIFPSVLIAVFASEVDNQIVGKIVFNTIQSFITEKSLSLSHVQIMAAAQVDFKLMCAHLSELAFQGKKKTWLKSFIGLFWQDGKDAQSDVPVLNHFHDEVPEQNLKFHIFGQKSGVDQALTNLDKLCEEKCPERAIIRPIIKELDEDAIELLRIRAERNFNVYFQVNKDEAKIKIKGNKAGDCRELLVELLDNLTQEYDRQNPKERQVEYINVEWFRRQNNTQNWQLVNDSKLEKEYKRMNGKGSVVCILEGISNVNVDFDKMTISAGIILFQLKRREVNDSIPVEWDYDGKLSHNGVELIQLDANSKEYKEIAAAVAYTSPGTGIVKIERVENPVRYRQYQLLKQSMIHSMPNMEVEKKLFHGINNTNNILSICRTGFDRGLAGSAVGTRYGFGSYFARDFKYSMDYSKNSKTIFYAFVLIGQYTAGDPNMKTAPVLDPVKATKYDSVVNDVANPAIFVVFTDNNAYPAYIITYS